MARKRRSKFTWVTLGKIALVCVIAIGIVFALNQRAVGKYWEAPLAENVEELGGYDSVAIAKFNAESQALFKQEAEQVGENSRPLSEKHTQLLEEINTALNDYYSQTYSFSVKGKLSQLEVQVAEFSTEDRLGFYNGSNGIYLSAVCEEEKELFITTYLEEAIGYLGVRGDVTLSYLYKGMAQLLAKRVILQGNLLAEEDVSLDNPACMAVAQELEKMNPDLLGGVVNSDGEYPLRETLNQPFGEQDFAGQLNCALQESMNGKSRGDFRAQLLTYEYRKALEGEEISMDLCHTFGLRWMFS